MLLSYILIVICWPLPLSRISKPIHLEFIPFPIRRFRRCTWICTFLYLAYCKNIWITTTTGKLYVVNNKSAVKADGSCWSSGRSLLKLKRVSFALWATKINPSHALSPSVYMVARLLLFPSKACNSYTQDCGLSTIFSCYKSIRGISATAFYGSP